MLHQESQADLHIQQQFVNHIHKSNNHYSNHQKIANDASAVTGTYVEEDRVLIHSNIGFTDIRSHLGRLLTLTGDRGKFSRPIWDYIVNETADHRLPEPSNISIFLCDELKLSSNSFRGCSPLVGKRILKMLQQRISNIMTCVLYGIPLTRSNQPGKHSDWMRDMNRTDRTNINTHYDSLNPINWTSRPRTSYYAVAICEIRFYKNNGNQLREMSDSIQT